MLDARLLARALGLFSVTLGAAQLLAPRRVSEWIGVRPDRDREAGMRAIGVRELATAPGLLAPRPKPAVLWLRVLGDAMDLALLGRAMAARGTRTDRTGAAMAAVAGVTALDLVGGVALTRRNGSATEPVDSAGRRVRTSISIGRSPDDLYAFWRDLPNLPRFMGHLQEVRLLDDRRSHWVARAPLGATVEWDAEIVEDRPGEVISWRSLEGAAVQSAGSVRFERLPGDRGTSVTADFEYEPPAGPLGVAIAKLSGEEPGQQASDDLRRLKQLLETGEVLVSDATVGRRRARQRPAQPPRDEAPQALAPAGGPR